MQLDNLQKYKNLEFELQFRHVNSVRIWSGQSIKKGNPKFSEN